jgi:hypothetical protein
VRVAPTVVASILRDARDLIATHGLSQGAPARDKDGMPLPTALTPIAVTISVLSAIHVAARRVNAADRETVVAIEKLRDASGAKTNAPNAGWSLADWADVEGRTTAQVCEAFNKAIANTMPALSRRAVGG